MPHQLAAAAFNVLRLHVALRVLCSAVCTYHHATRAGIQNCLQSNLTLAVAAA
jgi:hypothetical protein